MEIIDVIFRIMEKLDVWTIVSLSSATKICYRAWIAYKQLLLTEGTYKFSPEQLLMLDWGMNTQDDIYMQMPMSAGKTAVGLALANRLKGNTLILVPQKTIPVWIDEARRMYGDDVFVPEAVKDSKLLVLQKKASWVHRLFLLFRRYNL